MPPITPLPTRADVQRLTAALRSRVDGSIARADLYGTIDDFWSDYCQITGERWRARQEGLSLIEHSIYEFLTANPQLPRNGRMGLAAFLNLLGLLNDIQTEHTAVIEAAQTEPQVHAIDAPDTETGALWRAVKGGNGSIRIEDSDNVLAREVGLGTRRFDFLRTKVLAAFARMLATATGRALVRTLLQQTKQVRIIPRTHATVVSAQAFRAALRELNRRCGLYIPETPIDPHVGPAVTTVFGETMTALSFASALGNSKGNIDIRSGETLPTLPDSGSSSMIAFDPTITDASFLALDSLVNPLLTPLFLTIAHELIHALHNAQGTARGAFPMLHYDNREEYETISGDGISENRIRAEHHLGVRHGHDGFLTQDLAEFVERSPQVVIPSSRALTY